MREQRAGPSTTVARGTPLVPRQALPPVMVGWLIGSAAYVAAISALAHWPSIVAARGRGGAARPWQPAAAGVAVAVGLVALLTRASVGRGRTPAETVALVLVGAGAAWVAWGVVDQHLLRSFVLAPGSIWAGPWDGLFHGVGVLAAGLGTSIISGRHPPGVT